MMTKSHQEASCVVRLLPCVGRANARDPHTKDTVEEATGDSGRGSLRDGPSSRVAVTRDHASLPLSRKTADRTHTAAPTSSTLSTGVHSLTHPLVRHTHTRNRVECDQCVTRVTPTHVCTAACLAFAVPRVRPSRRRPLLLLVAAQALRPHCGWRRRVLLLRGRYRRVRLWLCHERFLLVFHRV